MAVVGRSFIVVLRAGLLLLVLLLLLLPVLPVSILIGTTVNPLFDAAATPPLVPTFPLTVPPLPPLALFFGAFPPEVTVIVVRGGSMIVAVEDVMIVLLLLLLLLMLQLLATFVVDRTIPAADAEYEIGCIFPNDLALGSIFAVTAGCTTRVTGCCVCRATVTIAAPFVIGTIDTVGAVLAVTGICCGSCTGIDFCCCAGATATTGGCKD